MCVIIIGFYNNYFKKLLFLILKCFQNVLLKKCLFINKFIDFLDEKIWYNLKISILVF